MSPLPIYLNALTEKGGHVSSVNDYILMCEIEIQ